MEHIMHIQVIDPKNKNQSVDPNVTPTVEFGRNYMCAQIGGRTIRAACLKDYEVDELRSAMDGTSLAAFRTPNCLIDHVFKAVATEPS